MKLDDDRYKEESAKREERFKHRQTVEEKKIEAVNTNLFLKKLRKNYFKFVTFLFCYKEFIFHLG
jgi:hypothetical protein